MKKSVQDAINKQLNIEFSSAYIYLGMAAWAEGEGLSGVSNWMRVQYEEEFFHTMKFFNFINERGGKVELEAIMKPSVNYKSVLDMFTNALAHEQFVTKSINELYEIALTEKDYPLQSLLQWYIDEQVEEEATAQDIIDKVKLIGNQGHALYMLDKELGQRTFTPPTSK